MWHHSLAHDIAVHQLLSKPFASFISLNISLLLSTYALKSQAGSSAMLKDKGSLLWIDLRDRFGITQITIETENISAEVIDLRTVRPIDYPTVIESVKKTNRLVLVEESWPLGSIATEIAFKVQKDAFDYLDAPVLRIMGGDVPLPYAPTLIQEYLPNPERVIKAVKEVMYVTK